MLADRGEFEGYNVERLNNAFNLQVENAAPYRPDWKGIVEKYFSVFQGRVKPFLPGYVEKDFNQRGAKDYRLDAKLNIKDFTKVMIAEVIYHNNHHYLKNYKRDKEMITDDVQPIPIELWNWGIKNRSGQLSYHSPEMVKLHLLPQATATVTERGIKFKKMHYMSKKAMKETWFATARIKGSWKVKISYDPRDMGKLYLLSDDGMTYEECTLLDHEERFMKKSLEEINYLLETEEYMKRKHDHRELKEEVNLFNQIQSIVTSTINKTNKLQTKNISNAKKISLIRNHRGNEKTRLRDKEKFELLSSKESVNNTVKDEKSTIQNFDKRSIKDILNEKNKK